MEWSRAKTIIIFALILLNVILFTVGYVLKPDMKINDLRKSEIINTLEHNNIKYEFKNENHPKELGKISAAKFEFNYDLINKAFFENPENLEPQIEAENVVYSDNSGTIYCEENLNGFTYFSKAETLSKTTGILEAERICSALLRKLGPEFLSFKLDHSGFDEDNPENVKLVYKYYYDGFKINSNEINFIVNGDQIIFASCVYLKPVKFLHETKKELYSNIDALFAYMAHKSSTEEADVPVVIDKITLVFEKDQLTEDDENILFIPCYAVYLENIQIPVLVNAYDNSIIE